MCLARPKHPAMYAAAHLEASPTPMAFRADPQAGARTHTHTHTHTEAASAGRSLNLIECNVSMGFTRRQIKEGQSEIPTENTNLRALTSKHTSHTSHTHTHTHTHTRV